MLPFSLSYILISLITLSYSSATIPPRWNHSDRSALLAFKSDIVNDPIGALSLWNDSLHHCHWQGILCSRRHPERVTTLNLTSLQLEGTLSPRIGNLSFLRHIYLGHNNFQGQIPPQIGGLFRLQFLSLRFNSFGGEIPSSLTRCSHLKLIDFNNNTLTGNILPVISTLSQLEGLLLFGNSFIGSIPSSFGNLSSLHRLSLGVNHLEGRIPSDLCKLQNLELFHVGGNKLTGELPPCLYNLSNLWFFSVGFNQLEGVIPPNIGHTLPRIEDIRLMSNKFSGPIPISSLCDATGLEIVDLYTNSFTGEIPINLTHCSNLRRLDLSENMLSGNIPASIGNLSSLSTIVLYTNQLEGSIPDDLCRITTLIAFDVAGNKLTGHVPPCLFNLSYIQEISVSSNQLKGNLPPTIGLNLPKVRLLFFVENKFTGHIPISLSNATSLEMFDFSSNLLTGPVPRHFGMLQNLSIIGLSYNRLGTQVGDDLEFITSLSNCTSLEQIEVSENTLKGPLPVSISNLYGDIPIGITKLIGIKKLLLERNHLTGCIPLDIIKLNNLRHIYMEENRLSGKIPTYLGNLTQLVRLSIQGNDISGSIPSSIGNCQNLEYLDFSQNRLSGTIPIELAYLSLLTIGLLLNHNLFTGPLPSQFGNLSKLTTLDVSENKLSDRIPESLGDCLNLVQLAIASNFFEAEIPNSLKALKGLQYLDLSHNNLYGEFPQYLDQFPLSYLNLSFNNLQGLVPNNGLFANVSAFSIIENKNLCGGMVTLNLPPCILKKKKSSFVIWKIISSIVGSLFLLVSLYFIFKYFRRKGLIRKTSGRILFDQPYRIGTGSYGSVFKGIIHEINQTVAMKVINRQTGGASNSFLRECNALKNIRHRNLVKVITICSSVDFQGNDFKALVFEFMSNGSLNEWLHPRVDDQNHISRNLNFVQRMSIAIDVASALEYLHHQQTPTIVHCDLKPSNVLLGDNMTAQVVDFGLAKIFVATSNDYAESDASSLLLRGAIGYVAPEYGMGSKVSTQGDVYSYGILLLEMFTKKKPTDDTSLRGLSLHNYSKISLPDQVMEIVDPILAVPENDVEFALISQNKMRNKLHECLALVIKLGV